MLRLGHLSLTPRTDNAHTQNTSNTSIQHTSGRRLLRSGGPNHSKSSSLSSVFLHPDQTNSLATPELLTLRVRWEHYGTRLEFTSDKPCSL